VKRVLTSLAIVLGVIFLAIQFVPVDRANPAGQTQVPASAEARAVLKRACYDCHSNETVWPWYSYVAPMSWLAAKDVKEGREKLNYSTWNLMSAEKQSEGIKESWEKIQSGEMPLWFYLPLHPSAKLSPADRAILQTWASTGGAGADTGGASGSGTGTGTSTGTGTGTGTGADGGAGAESGSAGTGGAGTGGAATTPPPVNTNAVGGGDGDGGGGGDRDGDGD
jgi:hypothetical protein